MAKYPQELAQDVVCQSHTGHMTGLWFLLSPAFKAEYERMNGIKTDTGGRKWYYGFTR